MTSNLSFPSAMPSGPSPTTEHGLLPFCHRQTIFLMAIREAWDILICKNHTLWCITAFVVMTITAMGGSRGEVIAESGDWRAFKSAGSCGIGIGNSAAFALFYFSKSDAYALDISSAASWNFSEGENPAIRIMSDGHSVLSRDDGAMRDNLIQFQLSADEAKTLLNNVSNGTRLQIQFPNSDNEGGFISLRGGRATASAFSRCVSESVVKTNGYGSINNTATPTFDMTFDVFHADLDDKIREDTIDKSRPDFSTINVYKKTVDRYTCNFHDTGFQSTIASFKKLDLLNGQFTLKLGLTVDTAGGKVSRITLSGDRRDPANMLQFIGTVQNVMQIFDPKAGQEEGQTKKILDDLGLMRGDSADDIGKPRIAIEPYAEIDCLIQSSHVTTHVECQFLPRS
jgi:hypothetical protein